LLFFNLAQNFPYVQNHHPKSVSTPLPKIAAEKTRAARAFSVQKYLSWLATWLSMIFVTSNFEVRSASMTQQLDDKLAQLQNAAELQSQSHAASRQQLYEGFVDAYLWWREADGQKDYLKNALKAADIKTRKRKGNAPNF